MAQPFADKADAYTAGRSGYAEALFDALYAHGGFSPDSAIADIGAGTGKSSLPLLRRGSTVYAVEPDGQMLARAVEALGGEPRFHPVRADGEHTGLRPGSMDHVLCASAFHWLDAQAFRAECRRILRPGGSVVLVWNLRDADCPAGRALCTTLSAHCPGFTGLNHGFDACQGAIRAFYGGAYRRLDYANDAVQDLTAFRARILSSSYAPRPGDAGFAALSGELDALFARFARGRRILLPTRTVACIGTPAP